MGVSQEDDGYCGVSAVVLDNWTRKCKLLLPKCIEVIITQQLKMPDSFAIDALSTLNLEVIPIKGTNGDKIITYTTSSDVREIFVPLHLQINSKIEVGIYEISFTIHRLTFQGVKFGLVSSFADLYKNTKFNPHDLVGGYIGIFTNDNNAIVCWDGLSQNTIRNNQWNQTYCKSSLERNDTIIMSIDTKHKLMHLTLQKYRKKKTTNNHNEMKKEKQYDICCVSFEDLIGGNCDEMTPCVSLLFHKDCIELSSIHHNIFKEHSPHRCPINKSIQSIAEKHLDIWHRYKVIIMMCTLLVLVFSICFPPFRK